MRVTGFTLSCVLTRKGGCKIWQIVTETTVVEKNVFPLRLPKQDFFSDEFSGLKILPFFFLAFTDTGRQRPRQANADWRFSEGVIARHHQPQGPAERRQRRQRRQRDAQRSATTVRPNRRKQKCRHRRREERRRHSSTATFSHWLQGVTGVVVVESKEEVTLFVKHLTRFYDLSVEFLFIITLNKNYSLLLDDGIQICLLWTIIE